MKERMHKWLKLSLVLLGVIGATSCITEFGQNFVAIDGNTAVIGNPDVGNSTLGEVYVFVREHDGAWRTQATLRPTYGKPNDQFGFSVALSGNTVLVGTPFPNSEERDDVSGSVYVFTRDDNGKWLQQAQLKAGDGKREDLFGASVALEEDIAVIGAPGNDDRGDDSGSVYVFTRDKKGRWQQKQKLLARDGTYGDWFGNSVALFSNTLVVGADMDSVHGDDSGSVYIFTRFPGGRWKQTAKLYPSDGEAGDWFGRSVALFGKTLAVGALKDDDRGVDSGSVYVFASDSSGKWTRQAKLYASDAKVRESFGNSIALFGNTLVVAGDGSAYQFVRDSDGRWNQVSTLKTCATSESDSAALYGGTALIGGGDCFVFTNIDSRDAKAHHFMRNQDDGWSEHIAN